MAKKAAAPKKTESGSTQNLVAAIKTVKQLQDFVKECGGVDKALEGVARVNGLIELTGGVGQLKQALEIVGREPAAEQPPQA